MWPPCPFPGTAFNWVSVGMVPSSTIRGDSYGFFTRSGCFSIAFPLYYLRGRMPRPEYDTPSASSMYSALRKPAAAFVPFLLVSPTLACSCRLCEHPGSGVPRRPSTWLRCMVVYAACWGRPLRRRCCKPPLRLSATSREPRLARWMRLGRRRVAPAPEHYATERKRAAAPPLPPAAPHRDTRSWMRDHPNG